MKRIAHVALGLPLEGHFDYWLSEPLREKIKVGQRVIVPLRNKRTVGYVIGLAEKSFIRKLKPVYSILEEAPVIPEKILILCRQFAGHYGCSLGEAIEVSLPVRLRQTKPAEIQFPIIPELTGKDLAQVHETILLLDKGQTKRWPLLIEEIKKVLEKGHGVIFLVPEAALIDRIAGKLKDSISSPVIILDRKLKPKEEFTQWLKARETKASIIVGTRSAVFAQQPALGLMIVYEEENPAYKQEQSPFYHAREVALLRSEIENSRLIFVSSSPSAEAWWLVQKKKAGLVVLENEKLAPLQLIDLANYKKFSGVTISHPLQSQIQRALEKKEKVLLFFNRRGFGTLTRCQECGFVAQCPRCSANLTYLYAVRKLVCRLCSHQEDMPSRCPLCSSSYLRSSGRGVEKFESDLARIFPQAKVARYDKETKQPPVEADLIIATQAVFKVIDRLNLSLIGVLSIDHELSRYDFRSGQKVFSLLTHLRQWAKDKVMVQTNHPEHYSLKYAKMASDQQFYKKEISLRKEMGLPPCRHLMAVVLRGRVKEEIIQQADELYQLMASQARKKMEVIEPHPDSTPKLRDQYRMAILIKGKSLQPMIKLVKAALKEMKRKKDVIVTMNVDG